MKTKIKQRTPQLIVMSVVVISSFSLAALANGTELVPTTVETNNVNYQQQNIPQQQVANYADQNMQNRYYNPQPIHKVNYHKKDNHDILATVATVVLVTAVGGLAIFTLLLGGLYYPG